MTHALRTVIESFRKDFPALQQERNGKPPVYLNAACWTPPPTPVIQAQLEYLTKFPTCGGGRGQGGWWGRHVEALENDSRAAVAGLLNARSSNEIVWTKNTTEGINIVVNGLPPKNRRSLKLLTTRREHNSVTAPLFEAERNLGGQPWTPRYDRPALGAPKRVVEFIELAKDGTFVLANALEAIERHKPDLLCLAHASNVDGTVISDEDIRAAADAVHAYGGWMALDAAQSAPHRVIDVQKLAVDFVAFSFHKMVGPSIGALYGREESLKELAPLVVGGGMVDHVSHEWLTYQAPPKRFEAGLQNCAGMAGAMAATKYVSENVGFQLIEEYERDLNSYLTKKLTDIAESAMSKDLFRILGPTDPAKRGGIVTLTARRNEVIKAIERVADERFNIMVRIGAFCVSPYLEYVSGAGCVQNNLRVSVYFYNTFADCDAFVEAVAIVADNALDAILEG